MNSAAITVQDGNGVTVGSVGAVAQGSSIMLSVGNAVPAGHGAVSAGQLLKPLTVPISSAQARTLATDLSAIADYVDANPPATPVVVPYYVDQNSKIVPWISGTSPGVATFQSTDGAAVVRI